VGNGTNATPVVRNNRCILRAGFMPPTPVILESNAGPDTIDISWTVGKCLGTEVHTFHVLFGGVQVPVVLQEDKAGWDEEVVPWQRSPPIAASCNGDQVSTYRIVRLKPGYCYQIVVLAESFDGFSSPPQDLEGKQFQKGPGVQVYTLKQYYEIGTMVALMGVVRRRNPIELAAIGCLYDPTTGRKLDNSVLWERAENAPAGGSQKRLLAGSENARASSTKDSKAQREQPSRSTEERLQKYMEQQRKNKERLQKYMEQQRKNKEFLPFIKSQLCECKELRDEYVRIAALHACARSHRCHRDRRNCPMALSCATTMFRL
jgi:hypothetical protein